MGGDNQTGPTFNYDAPDGLSTFTFLDYAVDGTAANFGLAPGVVGDGNADGTVSDSMILNAGNYTLFVGGAYYDGQTPTPDVGSYGIAGTISVAAVPEPSRAFLLLLSGAVMLLRRRKN